MKRSRRIVPFVILFCSFLFLGDGSVDDIVVLKPSLRDSLSSEQGRVFLVSVSREVGNNLIVSAPWEVTTLIDIETKEARDNFAKEFYKLVGPNVRFETISYSFLIRSGMTPAETLRYQYHDTVNLRVFWKTAAFAQLLETVKKTTGSSIFLSLRGWIDSVYTTDYDDPVNENRLLYKLQVRLIPGVNTFYFVPAGVERKPVQWTMRYSTEPSSGKAQNHFHNSELEQSCTSCHEGLPAESGGAKMKADCSTCHKAIVRGEHKHFPAEMKECSSCHQWALEQRTVVVRKGVPEACYDCHSDKEDIVENAQVRHPVAGECLTCHAPHSTERAHLLKQDIYSSCLTCHEDYGANHPVSRHPLRFAKVKKQNDKEISCASCHDPHGSEHPKLLRIAGGRFASCMTCHQ